MSNGTYRLLEIFRLTFQGVTYKHRNSTVGNKIVRELFEDLVKHVVSRALVSDVLEGRCVASRSGGVQGRLIRRNDSIFGRPPAGAQSKKADAGYSVMEGLVAEPRIGCEVKILAKAQLKQIDRVISDLDNFSLRMKRMNEKCINVALVGVNHESDYVGYEGGRTFKHPLGTSEAKTVVGRLSVLRESYDELLVFGFKATNQSPFPFKWLEERRTELDYGASLTRVGERYQERFQ